MNQSFASACDRYGAPNQPLSPSSRLLRYSASKAVVRTEELTAFGVHFVVFEDEGFVRSFEEAEAVLEDDKVVFFFKESIAILEDDEVVFFSEEAEVVVVEEVEVPSITVMASPPEPPFVSFVGVT